MDSLDKGYFRRQDEFATVSYGLFPFNFERIGRDKAVIVNDVGEYLYIDMQDLLNLVNYKLDASDKIYQKLLSKSIIYDNRYTYSTRSFAAKYKSRKSFVSGGPGLHIFVVTLRCINSCEYCQVSRKSATSSNKDMKLDAAKASVLRMFESPNQNITVEFQGGEPLLAFDIVKFVVNLILKLNLKYKKNVQFVIATTLQGVNEQQLDFMKRNNIHISISIDGPQFIHNTNRPNMNKNSYAETIAGLRLARSWLGNDKIAAMTTITKLSLGYYKEIVDEYVRLGFHSIFLRPLNIYGFAVLKAARVQYSSNEFLYFYNKALNYILEKNISGYHIDEVNASLLLNNIKTPFPTGYVDLRSPCGDGIGVLVYNYNGKVYPSDESRMLVEMGDDSLCLGSVYSSYHELISSPVIDEILSNGVAESLPSCSVCAYLPYCGANPIQNYSLYGDMVPHIPSSSFCKKQKGIINQLFDLLDDEEKKAVLLSWITNEKVEAEV